MKLTSGVDLVEIERIGGVIARQGARFLERFYTPAELAEVGHDPASLAARFAAKEAVSKALGCGLGKVSPLHIEILRSPTGAPQLYLHHEADRLAAQLGLHIWSLSLSHTDSHAIAMVVAMGAD